MKSFANYDLGVILRPRRTCDALMTDSRRLRVGVAAHVVYQLVFVIFDR